LFVGYVRVSTQEQSLQLQLDALKAAGCEKIFEETASGARRDRPQLQAALDYAQPRDCLVVWKLDRLARSLKQLTETVERLGEQAIGFRSLTERIDTTSAGGKLTFHLFSTLAEFARGIIRERTLAGLDAARAQDRVPGRPRSLNGSDLAAVRTLLANPKIPVAEIARRFNVDPTTIYRAFPGGRSAVIEGS